MKFKVVIYVLVIAILALFAYSIKLTFDLNEAVKKETALYKEADSLKTLANEANEQLSTSKEETQKKLDSMVRANVGDLWKVAQTINSLDGYSTYKAQNPNDSIHKDDLVKALDDLLKNRGYVQLIETNGNRLYDEVDLALDGQFVKFKTDKAVRNGAIGIKDCGAANPIKIGVVLKGKTVRVKNTCNANGSKSVWAHIEYSK